MPCAECHHLDSVIAQLRAALEERDQQLSDVNAKLAKQKLQSKAKFAQLKHQILENVAEKEGGNSQKIVENLLSKLDETENQLSVCREELDTLKVTLAQKETELNNSNERIGTLEDTIKHLQEVNATSHKEQSEHRPRRLPSDVASEDDETDDEDLRERLQQMYAQMVYKDSKIVDLNEVILRRDEKIIDLQESCRERDEVIWAKTKAIQVFQEKLNFYANREFRDIATETTAFGHGLEAADAGGPGRAVAFYRAADQAVRWDDDDSTSVTTETKIDTSLTLLEKFGELAEAIRNSSNGVSKSTTPTLNARLLDMVQQIETLQSRLVAMESNAHSQQRQKEEPKKKREKKVTFAFTEQERAQEVSEVTEKLHQAEQACSDLREENDDLRLTVADLERQLASNAEQMVDAEKYDDLESQLAMSLETIKALKIELTDTESELRAAMRNAESIYSARIQELEQQLEQLQHTFSDKERELQGAIDGLETRLYEARMENSKLVQEKEMILSDVDDLREAIETSQRLIDDLESDLQTANNELEDARATLESKRLEQTERVAALERDLSNQKLSAKAYEAKLRSAEGEKERLSELLEAQKQEWISLRMEGKEEVTGFRLKAKAYEAKFRILQDDNERLENLVVELKSIVDTVHNEKAELTRDYDRKLTEFEQEAKENLILIERAMADQKVEIETLKAELSSEARLKTKAYQAKWRSIERENERLVESVGELTRVAERHEEEKKKLSEELLRLKEKIKEDAELRKKQESELREAQESAEKREAELRTTLEKLHSTVESKTAECSALAEELVEAQSSVKSLRTQLDAKRNSLDQVKEQSRLLTDEKQDLETDLQRLWDAEKALKRRIGELERANGQLHEENVALRNRCQIADGEEQKLFDLTSSYELLKQDHARLQQKVEFLEATSSSQSSQLATELQRWKNSVLDLESEKAQLKQELLLSRQREVDLSEDKKRVENRLAEIDHRHAELVNEMNQQKGSLQMAMEENANLRAKFQAAIEQYNEVKAALDQARMESNPSEALVGEIAALRAAVGTANEEKTALQNELSQQKMAEAELQEQLSRLQSTDEQVSGLQLDLRAVMEQLSRLQLEKSAMEGQMLQLQIEKAALEGELTAAQSDIASMGQQLSSFRAERDELQTKTSSLESQLADFQEHLSLSVDRQTASQEYNPNLQLLKSEKERLENVVQELGERYKLAVQESKSLRGQLQESEGATKKMVQEFNDEIKRLSEDLTAKEQSISTLVDEKQMSQSNMENVTRQFAGFEEQSRQLVEGLRAENQELRNSQHPNVDARTREAEDAYQDLLAQFQENHVQRQILSNKLQEVESERQRLSEKAEELEHDREKLAEERQSLCAEVVALNEKLSVSDLLTEALKQDIESLVEENEALKTSAKENGDGRANEGDVSEARTDLVAQLEKQNRDVQENYQQLVIYYSELQSAYATVYQQYEQLRNKPLMFDAETEVDQANGRNELLEVGVNTEETSSVQKAGSESPSRGNTPDQSRSELIKLKAKLRKMEKTMDALEAKNRYLQEENTTLERRLALTETQLTMAASAQQKEDVLRESGIMLEEDVVQQKIHEPVSSTPETSMGHDREKETDSVSLREDTVGLDAETERKIAIAMAEARGLQQHISILVEQLNTSKSKNDDLVDRLGKAETEKLRLKKQFDDASETLEFLKQELSGVKQLCQVMDSEKQEFQRRLMELTAQENELKNSLAERTSAFASMQTAASESGAAMKAEMEELVAANIAQKEDLANAVNERDRAQEKVRRLLAASDELEIANHDLTDKIRVIEQRCSELEVLPAVREENLQLKNRMHDLGVMLQNWERQVGTLESTVQRLTIENAELVKSEKKAKEASEEMKAAAEKLKEESSQVIEDNALLRSVLEELEGKNQQLQDETDVLSARSQQLESLQDLVSYHKQLEQRFHEETEKCDETEKKLQAVTAELESAKANGAVSVERLTVEMDKMKANEAAALEKISSLEKQAESLKLELQRMALTKQGATISVNTDLGMNDLELIQQDLELEIAHLAKENEKLAQSRRELEEELREVRASVKESQDTHSLLEDLESKKRELSGENQLLLERREQLESAKKALEDQLQECKMEMAASARREKALERDAEALAASLEATGTELATMREKAEAAMKTISMLENQTEQLQNEIQEKTASETAYKAAQKTIEEAKVAISASNEELVKARNDYDVIRSLYEKLYEAYGQLEVANRTLSEQAETSNKSISEQAENAKLQLAAKEANEKKLQLEIEEVKATKEAIQSKLQSELEEVTLAVESMKNELERAAQENEKIEDELTKVQKTIHTQVQEMEAIRTSSAHLEGDKLSLTTELASKAAALVELERKVADAAEVELRNRHLISELTTKDTTVGDLKTRLHQMSAQLANEKAAAEKMNSSLQAALDRSSKFVDAFTRLGIDAVNLDNVYQYLDTLMRERDSFGRERSELVSKVEAVQVRASSYDREKEKSEYLASENASFKKQIERLQSKVTAAAEEYENELKDHQRQLEAVTALTVEPWQQYVQEVFSKMKMPLGTSFEETLKRLGSKLLELESTRISIDQDLSIWKSRFEKLESDDRSLKDKCLKLESGLESWRDKYRNLENEISLKIGTHSTLENEMRQLKERNAMLEEERDQWLISSRQVEEMKQILASAENLAREKTLECAQLEARLAQDSRLEARNAEMLKELEEARNSAADAERRFAMLQEENSMLNRRLEQLTVDNFVFQKRIEESDAELGELRKRMEEVSADNSDLTERLQAQKAALDDLEKRVEGQELERSDLVRQLEIQTRENDDLKTEVERKKANVDALRKEVESENSKLEPLQAQLIEFDELKAYASRQAQTLNEKETECVQLREGLSQAAEERHRLQTEFEARQRHETEMAHFVGAKDSEYRQELARVQNEFALETGRLQEELTKAVRERQDAVQWLEQERPKYVLAIRNLGEAKEQLAQQQRQLESSYLKLAELDVTKEKVREIETLQERTKMEKKELAVECERLRQESEAVRRQLAVERSEIENLKRQQQEQHRLEEIVVQKSSSPSRESSADDSTQRALVAENERLREELKVSENKNSHLLAKFRELEYQQQSRKRHSPPLEQLLDLEGGSERGDTISLMPARRSEERSLQLRRETLGSLSGDRSVLKSVQLWFRSKIRKYPYLSRRRPNVLKLLVIVYLLSIHVFVFICWFR